jgi:hypothetical protein
VTVPDLARERTAIQKIWARREKQILKVVESTARMYGEVQGIVGSKLDDIKLLDLL